MSAEPQPVSVLEGGFDDDESANQRVAETLDLTKLFLDAVFDDPALLDGLPDKATLAFREANLQGHVFHLTAARATGADEWVARPFRYTLTAGAPVFQRPVVDDRGMPWDTIAIDESFRAAGASADAALDKLEANLGTAINEALRVDLSEAESPGCRVYSPNQRRPG